MNNNFNEQLDKALNIWGAPKETLVEIVEAYQNNELGSNSNGSNENNSTSTKGCDCEEKLTSLQTQINELILEVNKASEQLNLLLNKLYDRSAIYNTNYDHIDPSILFTTYDFIEFDKNLTTTYSQTTYPVGLFCLNASNVTVKITLNIKATTAECNGQLEFYANGTIIELLNLENITLENKKFEFTFNLPLNDTGNYFETIVFTSSSPIVVTYLKYEAFNCTNPTFIKVDSRYHVEYFNGNYYISDCSGSTAKYAIAPADNFNSMNDFNWVDTGIDALSYRFIDNLVLEGSVYVHNPNVSNFYITKDNSFTLYDANYNKTYTEKNIIYAEPMHPRKDELNVVNTSISGRSITSNVYIFKQGNARSYSQFNKVSTYYMVYGLKNYLTNLTLIFDRTLYVAHKMDNTLHFMYKNVACDLGYGTFISGYVLDFNPLKVEVYTKVHDYCIKHNITYSSPTGTPKLYSYTSEVCGTYDKYFKGVKNDYFTIVDNKWNYYQSNLLDE